MNNKEEPNNEEEKKIPHTDEELLCLRIVHVLTIYPCISAMMLQMGLGPHTRAEAWRPQLQHLIDTGVVVSTSESHQTPVGRHQSYTLIRLAAHTSGA